MFTNAIVAAALTFAAFTNTPTAAPLEDEAGFSCVDQGNHICGPGSEAPAGLYDQGGVLIQPWTNYEHPELDPLYGVLPGTEYDLFGTEQYGGIPGGAVCATDADCARWDADKGAAWDEFDTSGADVPGELVQVAEVSVDELAWQEFQARGYVSSVFVPADIYTEITGKAPAGK